MSVFSTQLASADLMSAIAFDPTIRGLLVVMVAVGVLIGSVYLLLGTNTGLRNGFLIAMAGLTGWCFSLGLVWWIYGIGMIGATPSWTPREVNYDRTAAAVTEYVDALPNPDPEADELPDPVDLLEEYEKDNPEVRDKIEATEGEGFEPESLTQVVTLVPQLKSTVDDTLSGWRILSESDSRRGEAVAAADAELVVAAAFGSDTSSSSYTVHDVYFYGGKAAAEPETIDGERGYLSSAWHRVEQALQLKNPPLYAAITVQKNQVVEVPPGEAPPPAQIDPNAEIVTVVLERNLGNKRLIPFLFTLFTGILFAVFTWMLHTRDRAAMAKRAEWTPEKAS